MIREPFISLAELRAALHYDPQTGIFRWLRASRRAKVGDVAGTIRTDGRLCLKINNTTMKAHRLAWYYHHGVWPNGILDHIDCNPANNAISNLRLATYSRNKANAKSDNPLGKGVALVDGRYRASITVKYKRIYLGLFDTAEEAHAAYKTAAEEHFGEFARCR